jgi:hypothetical protein
MGGESRSWQVINWLQVRVLSGSPICGVLYPSTTINGGVNPLLRAGFYLLKQMYVVDPPAITPSADVKYASLETGISIRVNREIYPVSETNLI